MAYETGRPTVADPSTVTNRDEFGAFVEAVLADYLDLGRAEWENATVERLLDALSAFATTRVVTVIDDQEAPRGAYSPRCCTPPRGTSSEYPDLPR